VSTEAEELHRIISASVRDMLDAYRIQASAGPVTDKALEEIVFRAEYGVLQSLAPRNLSTRMRQWVPEFSVGAPPPSRSALAGYSTLPWGTLAAGEPAGEAFRVRGIGRGEHGGWSGPAFTDGAAPRFGRVPAEPPREMP
jgi:hypothetical protein